MRLRPVTPAPAGIVPTRSRAHAMAIVAGALLAVTLLPIGVAGQDRGAGPRDVEGPTWQLLEYRQDGELSLVPPGVGIEMTLWADTVSGSTACADFTSRYTVGGRDTIVIDPPEVTGRDCDPEAAAIDEVFFPSLTESATWEVDGSQLTLRDAAGEELLASTNARVPEDLTIAPWRLSRVVGSDGSVSRAVEGSDAVVRFLPGGRVAGRSGCGPFLGSYTMNGTTVAITDLESRLADCSGEIRTQAEQLVATLPEISDFSLRPAGMSLADGSGATRLAFTPDTALAQGTWTPIEVIDVNGETQLRGNELSSSSIRIGRRVDGRSLCGRYQGDNLRSGLAITMFDLEWPRCANAAREEDERAYIEALESVASHALRGSNLELLDQFGEPVMRLRPQPPLTIQWQLFKIDNGTGRKSKMEEVTTENPRGLRASFFEGGILTGETGVGSFNAQYDAGGGAIEILDPTPNGDLCTRRGNRRTRERRTRECDLQRKFLDYLGGSDSYVVREGVLQLLEGARRRLEFVPAQDVDEVDEEEEPEG